MAPCHTRLPRASKQPRRQQQQLQEELEHMRASPPAPPGVATASAAAPAAPGLAGVPMNPAARISCSCRSSSSAWEGVPAFLPCIHVVVATLRPLLLSASSL
jgi:hypothetical protein